MLNKLKKNDKKGFTLVELIVVLVILAILAALLVPALTGYIDRAKKKAIIAETRQTVMATQTLVDEAYGAKNVGGTVTVEGQTPTAATYDVTKEQIAKLAEVKKENIKDVTLTGAKVTKLTYEKSGKICTYENGDYTVAE